MIMICKNASGNYLHAKCESKAEKIDGTRKCMTHQALSETSKSMESSFAGKFRLVHVICYSKKRKKLTSKDLYAYCVIAARYIIEFSHVSIFKLPWLKKR